MNVKASTQYKREHKADYGKEKIEILYEDKDIVIINKPTGMLSVPYPGSKARTALSVLEKIYRSKGTYSPNHRPYIVHRLDRDTSGVMMFALNESVQKKIMAEWHTMVTERLYHAVAENPRDKSKQLAESGTIDEPLAQNAHHVGYVPHDEDDHAKTVKAITHYKIIERGKTHTLFELNLETGKKNQIRAHLASKGYPLAGDENYRAKTDPFHRLALHARTLAFKHPVTGTLMRFESPESKEWLEYVIKGDEHPATAIWNDKSSPYNKKHPHDEGANNNYGAKRIPKKKACKMDFISRGKMLSK